ncbi:hypothetical protein ACFXG4_45040 [Nocardia sp. NPDC059246]|uniref:hypothetical protein n=1 Tax=unclassified Nocardia TaxID=2637762 RepID=UPI0036AEF567
MASFVPLQQFGTGAIEVQKGNRSVFEPSKGLCGQGLEWLLWLTNVHGGYLLGEHLLIGYFWRGSSWPVVPDQSTSPASWAIWSAIAAHRPAGGRTGTVVDARVAAAMDASIQLCTSMFHQHIDGLATRDW